MIVGMVVVFYIYILLNTKSLFPPMYCMQFETGDNADICHCYSLEDLNELIVNAAPDYEALLLLQQRLLQDERTAVEDLVQRFLQLERLDVPDFICRRFAEEKAKNDNPGQPD